MVLAELAEPYRQPGVLHPDEDDLVSVMVVNLREDVDLALDVGSDKVAQFNAVEPVAIGDGPLGMQGFPSSSTPIMR
jgi:hypothetical protein